MTVKEYKKFLKSATWREFREMYRQDTDYKCYVCGAIKDLNLHHYQYRKNLLDPVNIVVLCKKHHKVAHFQNGNFKKTTGLKGIIKARKNRPRRTDKMTKDFKCIGNGQECRACDTITDKFSRIQLKEYTKKKTYYFGEYDDCPECHARYMINDTKVYNKGRSPRENQWVK